MLKDIHSEKTQSDFEHREFFITSGVATEPRFSHKPNQDTFFQLIKQNAFGVFDGLGGIPNGDVAAAIARDTIQAHLKTISAETDSRTASEILRAAFADASQRIKVEGARLGLPTEHSPCTTAVVFIMIGKTGVVAHCGDSRLYCVRHGAMIKITDDDNALRMPQIIEILQENRLTAEQVDTEFDNMTSEKGLSPVASALLEYRQIVTNTLGQSRMEPHITEFEIEAGDVFLLCSDGIANLTHSEIKDSLNRTTSPAIAAAILVHNAAAAAKEKHFRAHADDGTAVVVKVD